MTSFMIPLNLPVTPLKLSKKDGQVYVKCLVRQKNILLTPEEWVRQHLIAFLSDVHFYPKTLMSVEKGLTFNGLKKRWDLVVLNRLGKPQILVECKKPDIPLDEKVVSQIGSYQSSLQCDMLLITNGLSFKCWRKNKNGDWISVQRIPSFEDWRDS